MEDKFKIGNKYTYHLDDEFDITGVVKYNDGISAILRVTNMYMECQFETLSYDEVRDYFPTFEDTDVRPWTAYLCLDIDTEYNLFFNHPHASYITRAGEWYDEYRIPDFYSPEDFQKDRNEKMARKKEIEKVSTENMMKKDEIL